MPAKLFYVRRSLRLLLLLAWTLPSWSQALSGVGDHLTPTQAQALVETALANELHAAQAQGQLMRYQLRKTSPNLTTTKEILETKDGDVARLLSINDQPLAAADEQKERARLQDLLNDPRKQRHRKQAEDADAARALKVLRVLPDAFEYQFAGPGGAPSGGTERFTFRPNPRFSPPDLETQALTAMGGELWIDPVHQRVVRLEGHLRQGVDFGWGVLGHLNKGGWIVIEQADVGEGEWRIVRFQMAMSGRVVFKTRVFDTTEVETHFALLPAGTIYQNAIGMLLANR
jgi:hypothetical protein